MRNYELASALISRVWFLPGDARQQVQNRVENPGHGGVVQRAVFLGKATFLYSAVPARKAILQFQGSLSRTVGAGDRLRRLSKSG